MIVMVFVVLTGVAGFLAGVLAAWWWGVCAEWSERDGAYRRGLDALERGQR